MIAALFVLKNGPYFSEGFDAYDVDRDAKKYKGPHKVIAHPPCERWGRYWGGGPMLHGTEKQKLLGDDDGCFAHALFCVRSFGGVLEHPEASHAFHFYGLPIPKQTGGWTPADRYGGRSCCVAQGHYGHEAQKLTWLYGKKIKFLELKWGRAHGKTRIEEGYHSRNERAKAKNKPVKRISEHDRIATPVDFRNLLVEMVA